MSNDSLEYILDQIRGTVSSIDAESQTKLIDEIVKAKTVFIYGAGRSGLVGQLFAVRLVQIGLDVHFIGDMTTPIISKDDLTILISNTGETMSAVQTANIARRIGCRVACLTSNAKNKLAHASNLAIIRMRSMRLSERFSRIASAYSSTVSSHPSWKGKAWMRMPCAEDMRFGSNQLPL